MDLRKLITGRNLLISLVILGLGLSIGAYLLFRKPPQVPLEQYVPASTLAYIEINSLTDVLDGLTGTKAWRELAPALGLSGQLKQLGSGIDLMSRTGFGPDEVVTLGRAQYAIVVTGLEAKASSTEESASLNIKPQFALLAETHTSAERAARLINERASLLATRIFGDATKEESGDYQGVKILTYRGEQEGRQLVAAASGSVILIANHEAAAKACLDAIGKRVGTLAEDQILKQQRTEVGTDGKLFAYLTNSGIEKLTQVAPALFATRFTNDPDKIGMIAHLFSQMSKQTAEAFFYSLEFRGDGVTEKYFTALRPQLAKGLAETMKPINQTDSAALRLVPQDAPECTLLRVEAAGAIPENLLKGLSPGLDLVAGLALREFVLGLRRQLGLEAGDTLASSVGSEVAIIKTDDAEPVVMVFRVKERSGLAPAIANYLTQGKASVSKESYRDVEINLSSNEDGRAAAFVGDYLVLGTKNQIIQIADAQANGRTSAQDEQINAVFSSAPKEASVVSYEADEKRSATMMLAISKLTRVTDGSADLLEQREVHNAMGRLPKLQSYTVFRSTGVYSETHSAVGIFKRLGDWLE
jgi:hypothetical protein